MSRCFFATGECAGRRRVPALSAVKLRAAFAAVKGRAELNRIAKAHFVSANSVGVLPVTWRNAYENAGTLA
jgi:hypothetical protein